MLFNRLQSTSSLLAQTQFSFATKNLKAIKIRMKAVESIKKITKVIYALIPGHEDGRCLQNESRRHQTRKSQTLRCWIHPKSHRQLNFPPKEKTTLHPQKMAPRPRHLWQGSLRRCQLRYRQISQGHGQGWQKRLQSIPRWRQGIFGPDQKRRGLDWFRYHPRPNPTQLPHRYFLVK